MRSRGPHFLRCGDVRFGVLTVSKRARGTRRTTFLSSPMPARAMASQLGNRRVSRTRFPSVDDLSQFSHNQGHQETKTDATIRGRRRSPLTSRSAVIGSGLVVWLATGKRGHRPRRAYLTACGTVEAIRGKEASKPAIRCRYNAGDLKGAGQPVCHELRQVCFRSPCIVKQTERKYSSFSPPMLTKQPGAGPRPAATQI